MKKLVVITAVLSLMPLSALADRVLPAQADDIAKADANLGKGSDKVADSDKDGDKDKTKRKHTHPANFGAMVSKEAKNLKDATVAERKAFGQSIADQRRQNSSQSPNSHASSIATVNTPTSPGGDSDPRSHVPSQGDASSGAGRPAGPGKH